MPAKRLFDPPPVGVEIADVDFLPLGGIDAHLEIAAAVQYLCCDNAAFTTGQALAVDGGATAI